MEFYFSIFEDAKVLSLLRWGKHGGSKEGAVLTAKLRMAGQEFIVLNGGPEFKFNEAISLTVDCADQNEVDYYWERLTADGGEPGPCGWLKDKFGVSWQIAPAVMMEMLLSENTEASDRAMGAMMKMKKLDIATLVKAYEEA